MGRAIRANRPHLATGELGYHVLDTLLAIEEAEAGQRPRDNDAREPMRLDPRAFIQHFDSRTPELDAER
jgi:hypothetical protein